MLIKMYNCIHIPVFALLNVSKFFKGRGQIFFILTVYSVPSPLLGPMPGTQQA